MSAMNRVRHAQCPWPAHMLGDPPRGDPWRDHPVAPLSPVGAQRASVSVETRRGGVRMQVPVYRILRASCGLTCYRILTWTRV